MIYVMDSISSRDVPLISFTGGTTTGTHVAQVTAPMVHIHITFYVFLQPYLLYVRMVNSSRSYLWSLAAKMRLLVI